MTATASRRRVPAEQALAVVGLTVRQVLDGTGGALRDGEAYLVGSLASGLGNAHSDVDLHLLVAGLERPVGPTLHFAAGITVDVEEYPAAWPARVLEDAAARPTARLPFGGVALGAAVDGRQRRWTARWVHATPLFPDTAPVFTDEQVELLLPLLLREAFDQLVLAQAVAHLADAAEGGPFGQDARGYLWKRAGRALTEVRCRAAGDVTTGEKWLADRAARLGLDICAAHDRDGHLAQARRELGMTPPDARRLVLVRPAEDARRARLAGRDVLVNRHDQLLEEWVDCRGPLLDALGRYPAARLLEAVRRGELELSVDPDALEVALRCPAV